MSFADFAEGFADGFIPTFTARMDRQDQEDAEIAKIKLQQKGKLYESRAEQERAARELRRQAENLYNTTGKGDVGIFYQLLDSGMKPADIYDRLDRNPNLFQQIDGNTSPTRAPVNVQTPFEQGVDAMDQFGGPTVEARAALDARRAAAPAVDLAPRDVDLLARTIIGEAASEPIEGKIAVANVVMNRIQSGRFGGSSMQDVLFARNQFEPWTNPATRNRLMNISTDSPEYQEAFRIAQAVAGGTVPDVTNGATHFANPDIVRRYHQEGKATSSTLAWVQNIEQNGTRIGRHVFGNADAGANSRQTTMSTGGSINPTDQQMEGAFSEPTVVPEMRMPEPQTQPANQQQSPDNAFSTLLGVNQAQRDRDISARVDRLSQAAGISGEPSSGFASPPQSNFRLNLGDEAVDVSQYIGASETKINQALTYHAAQNTPNLSEQDFNTLNEMAGVARAEASGIASSYVALLSGDNPRNRIPVAMEQVYADIAEGIIPEDRAEDVLRHMNEAARAIMDASFSMPKDRGDADFRFDAAKASGDLDEQRRLYPFTTEGQTESYRSLVMPRAGGLGQVRRLKSEWGDTGIVYKDQRTGETISTDDFEVREITPEQDEAETNLVTNPNVNGKITEVQDSATILRQTAVLGNSLGKLISEDERVTTAAGRIALAFDNIRNDGLAILSVLEEVAGQGNISEAQANQALIQRGILKEGETLESLTGGRTLDDVVGLVESNNVGAITQLANNRRGLEAIIALGAFRLGSSEGQTGRNVSNLFFREFREIIAGARTEEQVKQRLTPQLNMLYSNYLDAVTALEGDNQVRTFVNRYEAMPELGPRLEDFMGNAPELADAFDYFGIDLNQGGRNRTSQGATGSSVTPTQDQQPQQSTGRTFTVTDEMAARNSRLAPLVGRTVVAVPAANGQFTIEIVE